MLNFKKFFIENDNYILQKIENLWIQFFNNPTDNFVRSILSDLLKETAKDENYQQYIDGSFLTENFFDEIDVNISPIFFEPYYYNGINEFITECVNILNETVHNNFRNKYNISIRNIESLFRFLNLNRHIINHYDSRFEILFTLYDTDFKSIADYLVNSYYEELIQILNLNTNLNHDSMVDYLKNYIETNFKDQISFYIEIYYDNEYKEGTFRNILSNAINYYKSN